MKLAEKYRPQCLSDIIGQDRAVSTLKRLAKSGYGGTAYYISGKAGTGKTSLARIIAAQVADHWDTREVVGRDLTKEGLEEIVWRWNLVAMGDKGGHALIVNESHGMSKATVERLLQILEPLPQTVCVVFTTTNDGNDLFEDTKMDAGAFASRCLCIKLTNQGLTKPFAARLREIAQIEGMDGQPEAAYVRLVTLSDQNFRDCLNKIEAGEMLK